MDHIILHTSYLLKNHDCVIVPGMGAFLVTHHGAWIDTQRGSIVPPTREYSFNSSIVNNDGLIVNSIARRDRVSYETACSLMASGVDRMRMSMQDEGEVAFPGIGRLTMGEEGNIRFLPAMTPEERAERIGMPTLAVVADSSAKTDNDVEVDSEENIIRKKKGYWYIPVNKMAAKIAASVILVAAVAVSIIIPSSRNDVTQMQPTEYQAAAVPTVKHHKAPEVKVEKPAPEVMAEPEEVSPLEKKHHVIVAAFHKASEAEQYVEEQKNAGREMYIIPSKRLYKIAAMGSDNREELQAIISTPEFQEEFAGSWIFSK